MQRYCSIINHIDGGKFISDLSTSVNINIKIDETYVDDNESTCFFVDKRDAHKLDELFKGLHVSSIGLPAKVPAWKRITHNNGPILSDIVFKLPKSVKLLHKTKPTVSFSIDDKIMPYVVLYATRLKLKHHRIDDVFNANFWTDFKHVLDAASPFRYVTDIDFSQVLTHLSSVIDQNPLATSTVENHSFVKIDGKRVNLESYATPPPTLLYGSESDPNRGKYRRGIVAADVILNMMPNDTFPDKFTKSVYVPSARWSSKWLDPITSTWKYTMIDFQSYDADDADDDAYEQSLANMAPFPAEFDSSVGSDDDENDAAYPYEEGEDGEEGEEGEEVMEADDDYNEGEEKDYGSEFSEIEHDYLEDIGSIESDNEDGKEAVFGHPNKELKRFNVEYRLPLDQMQETPLTEMDFQNLTKSESVFLPLNFIISEEEQWEAILTACKSNFSLVSNLAKVNDKVLAFVADVCSFAAAEGIRNMVVANFLTYAQQRERIAV